MAHNETSVDAVLFDYSGVLTTSIGIPDEAPFDQDAAAVEMISALATADDHPWHALERGELALADFIADVERRVAGLGVMFDVNSELNVMANLQLLDARLALVERVKASGARVGLVTNNVAEWRPLWLPGLPHGLFDVVIDSSQVGCRKPEPAIYELAMSELGITEPSRVAFVDDFEWNVAGAEAAGMVGVHCTPDADLDALVFEAIA